MPIQRRIDTVLLALLVASVLKNVSVLNGSKYI